MICCRSFTVGLGRPHTYSFTLYLQHIINPSEGEQLGDHCNDKWEDKTSGRAWLFSSPSTSVHLFKEFVGGVFIAMVLHFVELSFFRCQHGVDLLRDTQELELLHSDKSTNKHHTHIDWELNKMNMKCMSSSCWVKIVEHGDSWGTVCEPSTMTPKRDRLSGHRSTTAS